MTPSQHSALCAVDSAPAWMYRTWKTRVRKMTARLSGAMAWNSRSVVARDLTALPYTHSRPRSTVEVSRSYGAWSLIVVTLLSKLLSSSSNMFTWATVGPFL